VRLKEVSCSVDSCIVLRYLVDAEREITVPVGIVLSDEATGSLRFRLPREGEEIAGVCLTIARPYLEMAQAQIEAWLQSGTLPYALEPPPPLSLSWWDHVRGLMQWRVRLDPPRVIDCRLPEEEIEALHRAWVQPQSPSQEADGSGRAVEEYRVPPGMAAPAPARRGRSRRRVE
jgi:hypothetical protein